MNRKTSEFPFSKEIRDGWKKPSYTCNDYFSRPNTSLGLRRSSSLSDTRAGLVTPERRRWINPAYLTNTSTATYQGCRDLAPPEWMSRLEMLAKKKTTTKDVEKGRLWNKGKAALSRKRIRSLKEANAKRDRDKKIEPWQDPVLFAHHRGYMLTRTPIKEWLKRKKRLASRRKRPKPTPRIQHYKTISLRRNFTEYQLLGIRYDIKQLDRRKAGLERCHSQGSIPKPSRMLKNRRCRTPFPYRNIRTR